MKPKAIRRLPNYVNELLGSFAYHMGTGFDISNIEAIDSEPPTESKTPTIVTVVAEI